MRESFHLAELSLNGSGRKGQVHGPGRRFVGNEKEKLTNLL